MDTKFGISIVLPLLLVGGLISPQAASAQVLAPIEVGGTTDTTSVPFGADTPGASPANYAGEYQQIYSASAFTMPVAITQISFASASDASGLELSVPETATYNLIVGFSNTSASVAAPSTTFADNIGTPFTTVFSGVVTANLQANNVFDLNIPFTTPFFYTPGLPGQPNLLLDVFINSATATKQTDLFQSGDTGMASRVYYSDGKPTSAVATDQSGLRTLFTVVPAPEPSPALSLLLGIGGVALACGLKAVKRKSRTA